MKSMIDLKTVFGGYPQLYSRLLEILGSSNKAQVSVVHFNVDSKAANIQIFLKFDDGNLPINFQKKSRNFLRFQFTVPDFFLTISQKTDKMTGGEIISVSESHIVFVLGSFLYSFSGNSAVFYRFEASNYYELVDRNFGISLGDLVGET